MDRKEREEVEERGDEGVNREEGRGGKRGDMRGWTGRKGGGRTEGK